MNVLEKIVQTTRQTVSEQRRRVSASELSDQIAAAPAPRGFVEAIASASNWSGREAHVDGDASDASHNGTPSIALIAEVKRASPSAGRIREDFDPPTIAKAYTDGGATCISVLTDGPYFQGSLDDLRAVRGVTDLPLLRKDFIIDSFQIDQARAAGADAVLLIAECLTPTELRDLFDHATGLGMDALIELYEPDNLDAVLATGGRLVGVNNRDLRTFQTDLQHCLNVGARLPKDRLLVAESGIHTDADVRRVASGGAQAMLVGESLMRKSDVRLATEQLLGRAD